MTEDFKTALDAGPAEVVRWTGRCGPDQLAEATRNYGFRADLADVCDETARRAYALGDRAALEELHAALALVYDADFSGATSETIERDSGPVTRDLAAILERAMLGHEAARIDRERLAAHPDDGTEYVRWLKGLINDHPAGWHPLYHQHLVASGTVADLRLLLAQETNLDPRFDDILASMQIGRVGGEKMEIASNYWDEMGNGDPASVHTTLFAQALLAVGADDEYIADNFLLEGRISGNISACLALSRRHYFKAVGYFGATEYLAPRRFRCVVDAWRRHDLDEVGIRYHDLHIGVDAAHASGWFKNVVVPLVNRDARVGADIAMGALIRLNTSEDYLDALLSRMRGDSLVAGRR